MFDRSDHQLVQSALKGNKKAWYALLSRYEKAIYNYAMRMTGNPQDAKDLLQDIFIALFNSLSTYQQKASFKSWLFRIAHFKCMDFYRRKKDFVSLDEHDIELSQHAVEHQNTRHQDAYAKHSPEAHLEQSQSLQQIIVLMQALPFNQRIVIELKFFNQFTFDEISRQLDVSSNTVKSRLYAALGTLKKHVTESNIAFE